MSDTWLTSGVRLDASSFPKFLQSRKVCIVLFERSIPSAVSPLVPDYFAKTYPDLVGFGRIDLATIPYDGWEGAYVKSVRGLASPTPTGLYLFIDGRCRSFHPGQDRRNSELLSLVDIFLLSGSYGGAVVDRWGKDILAKFDPLVRSRLAATPRPSEVAVQPPKDPYAVLGVPKGASRDEVKSAWAKLRLQYHPDRVEGMAEEVRKLVHDRSVAINKAFDDIKLARGW